MWEKVLVDTSLNGKVWSTHTRIIFMADGTSFSHTAAWSSIATQYYFCLVCLTSNLIRIGIQQNERKFDTIFIYSTFSLGFFHFDTLIIPRNDWIFAHPLYDWIVHWHTKPICKCVKSWVCYTVRWRSLPLTSC